MKKSDCLLVLAALPKKEIIRIIIDTPSVSIDINRSVAMAIDYLTHEFSSPWKTQDYKMSDCSTYKSSYVLDSNMNKIESDCIQLVGHDFDTRYMDSFDLVVWFNDVTATKEEYTDDQKSAMWHEEQEKIRIATDEYFS